MELFNDLFLYASIARLSLLSLPNLSITFFLVIYKLARYTEASCMGPLPLELESTPPKCFDINQPMNLNFNHPMYIYRISRSRLCMHCICCCSCWKEPTIFEALQIFGCLYNINRFWYCVCELWFYSVLI